MKRMNLERTYEGMIMEHTINFISATDNDATTIIELRRQIWATTYRGIYPDSMIDDFDYTWHKEKELQRIRNPQYFVFLISYDGRNIGYLTTRKADVIILLSLYVVKKYQHKGIGKQGFDFVNKYCRDNDAHSFICHCVPENFPARRFYEKMGGVIIGG